jgi:hypothetical protein
MRRLKAALLWLMDVLVGIFIGPIEHGERTHKVSRIVARRGLYTIGFGLAVFLLVLLYMLVFS